MKYSFKPQTALLVAGMVATAYASCYIQATSGTAVCFASGTTVDMINYWHSGPAAVIATSDWVKGYQSGTSQTKNLLNAYTIGGVGSSGYTSDTPVYCYGPAKFVGPGGNETVSYWENGAAAGSPSPPTAGPANGGYWGLPTGTSCP